MDTAALAAVNIDYDDGLKRFSGYGAIYEKYLRKFVDDNLEETLNGQMAAKDYAGAYETAHKMKGVIGNLSINGLYGTVTALCDRLKNGADIGGAVKLYPDFVQELAAVKAVLREQL